MKRKIAGAILKVFNWKVIDSVGYIPQCVICVAPHTSNYDFLVGKLAYMYLGRKACFLMKKSWFFFPLGIFLKSIGGIPVDRSKNNSLTQQMSEEFHKRTEFQIAITPEATRKANKNWKKGFYFIAKEANVPILLAYIDYAKRIVEFQQLFIPSENVDLDIEEIKKSFIGITARHPEKFVI